MELDPSLGVEALTAALVDIRSESGSETRLADAIEEFLRLHPHLDVVRDDNAVVARTSLGRDRRLLLAGHIDTVPVADNLPSRRDADRLHGCGTSDMKSGVAVMLRLAATLTDSRDDVTYVFYDNEEVDASRNGLGRLARTRRAILDADLAILLEPTNGRLEAGCQGTLRVLVAVGGRRAHSARAWLGVNAIHATADLLARLAAYEPRSVEIDGLTYREGLTAVRIQGGIAGNVVPDRCTVTINFRFAPDRSEEQALDHVREVLAPYECVLTDSAPAAMPLLDAPALADFITAIDRDVQPKYGWTDVARLSSLGIPAINFGPGDPDLAHAREESVELSKIVDCEAALRRYLTATT